MVARSTDGHHVEKLDLVIVGAGPAGLMLAAWASRCKLKFRIIDNKLQRVEHGRADGLHPRTLEILQSFGLAETILSNSCLVHEIASWAPKDRSDDGIHRTGRCRINDAKLGRYTQVSLQQGMIEQLFIDFLQTDGGHEVHWNTSPVLCEIDHAKDHDYPIRLKIGRVVQTRQSKQTNGVVTPEDDDFETLYVKYLVGADGAHSWVRRNFDISSSGDRTDSNFGVMDIVPITDFPDIRFSCSIHSNKHGSIMSLPREKQLVRLYVQLPEGNSNTGNVRNPILKAPDVLRAANKILHPYKLDYKICDWISNYTIGQRVADSFGFENRVFIVGDACHTHSPTMGVGMNISMQDSYNLGWKLAMVIKGTADASILHSYNDERRPVAQKLIELDKRMSSYYIEGPSETSYDYENFRDKFSTFLSGAAVTYDSSATIAKVSSNNSKDQIYSKSWLATGAVTGRRLPPMDIECQGDGNVWNLQDTMPSTGQWTLLVFSGSILRQGAMDQLQRLSQAIERSRSFREHSPQTYLIHSSIREDLDFNDFPAAFRPFDEELGYDYWKIFTSETQTRRDVDDDAYRRLKIDRYRGCMVLCRPDQHVALICGIEDFVIIEAFLAGLSGPARSIQPENAAVNDEEGFL